MKQIFILIVCILFSNAKDKIYFMPEDGNNAQKEISYLISHAHKNIDIAMYSFTNKIFLKVLKKAARKGVKIRIVADKSSNSNQKHYSIVPQLAKLRNIEVHLLSGKSNGRYRAGIMHIKLLIVDKKIVAFGSANYTYSAFHKNYELLYINDDYRFTKRFISIFEKLWHANSHRHAYDREVSHFFKLF
jgi:phosphatidylserine/phosphatidylglycerophosphate/cardiolipin synthase-like enzyme